jgi:hypothetical protein
MSAVETSSVERAEEELSWVGLVAAESLRAVEVATIGFATLLVCPPLLILAVIVLVPAVALAALVAVVAVPVLVVRHFHRHRAGRAHLRIHRLAALGRSRAGTATSRLERVPARVLARLSAPPR